LSAQGDAGATRFKQYSVLGTKQTDEISDEVKTLDEAKVLITGKSTEEKAIFLNTNAPWSAFICGSQGSGKSYTLSCMLENLLDDLHTHRKDP